MPAKLHLLGSAERKPKRDAARPRPCLFPGCRNTRRTRGQCHSHYQLTQSMLRAGEAVDEDLVRRGLRTAPGDKQGGSPIAPSSREVFRLGDKTKGKGASS